MTTQEKFPNLYKKLISGEPSLIFSRIYLPTFEVFLKMAKRDNLTIRDDINCADLISLYNEEDRNKFVRLCNEYGLHADLSLAPISEDTFLLLNETQKYNQINLSNISTEFIQENLEHFDPVKLIIAKREELGALVSTRFDFETYSTVLNAFQIGYNEGFREGRAKGYEDGFSSGQDSMHPPF